MAGIDFLSFPGLWLLLAGFILGFAASTLWEWLYYRGKRSAPDLLAPTTTVYPVHTDNPPPDHNEPVHDESKPTWDFSYRSPGVYLESEQTVTADDRRSAQEEPQAKVIIAPPPDPIVTSPVRPDPNSPRLNPATLAALQTTVAQTAIAQPAEPATTAAGAIPTEAQTQRHPLLITPTLDAANKNGIEQPTPPRNGEESHAPHSPVATPPAPVAIAAAGQLVVQPSTTTTTTDVAVPDHPDNLAMIRGVGEAYKRRLYGVGIYTWRQVAESDIETLRRVTRAKPNADINAWRAQARELAEKYQRWQTTFGGPLDDLTRIDGIGAITADLLYKAGICTYEQLAGTLSDELANIVPAPTVGDENDFEGWITAAVRLANVKRRNEGLLA